MKIGLDIDNVITDFDNAILKEVLIFDKQKRNAGIINKNAEYITKGMFDWTNEETKEFYANNMQRIAMNLNQRLNCKKIIDRLFDDGHEVYLISHRAYPDYTEPFEVTTAWLKKHKINYTKLILSETPDKTKECEELGIDVMVDDRVSQCTKMAEQGVYCIVMKTKYNKNKKHDLPIATSWNNLYEKISAFSKQIEDENEF